MQGYTTPHLRPTKYLLERLHSNKKTINLT